MQKKAESSIKRSYHIATSKNKIDEALKAQVPQKNIRFPSELGEDHPFNFSELQMLYTKFGYAFAAVNKYVDFMLGGGFYVKSKDKRAEKIINDFILENNFDSYLRAWIKEALITGNGFLELGGTKTIDSMKVLDSQYMYVKRSKTGTVEAYNQYTGALDAFAKNKVLTLEPRNVSHIKFNSVGSQAYGVGILYPALNDINNLLGLQKELFTLIKRKANAPIDVTLGSYEHQDFPSQEEISSFGSNLEWLNNKHEWTHGPNVQMKVLEFGNFSEKFTTSFDHYKENIFATVQVPHVLMGKSSVAEGLADTQMDSFERNMGSHKAEVEKNIENDIFKRVLESQDIYSKVEFEWGRPSNKEKNDRLTRLNGFLSLAYLNPTLRSQMEEEVARLLDLNAEVLMDDEEQKKKEDEEEQPRVPGQNNPSEKHSFKHDGCVVIESSDDDYELKEWLGFNYNQYRQSILDWLDSYDFKDLLATTPIDYTAGKLSVEQTDILRKVLQDGFSKEQSIRKIEENILKEVKISDLYRVENGELVKDKEGKPVLVSTAENRAYIVARTESTRAANEGALSHYKTNEVEKVRWISSFGNRTCPDCQALNGSIYTVEDARGRLPRHTMCRCSFAPVVSLTK